MFLPNRIQTRFWDTFHLFLCHIHMSAHNTSFIETETGPKWRESSRNTIRFIRHVPKTKTWKWWNEFMNQFYVYTSRGLKPTRNMVQILIFFLGYNVSLLIWTWLAFVKVFYIWIYFVICFISELYAHSWESVGRDCSLCCLLIYIFSNEHGNFFAGNNLHIFVGLVSQLRQKYYRFFILLSPPRVFVSKNKLIQNKAENHVSSWWWTNFKQISRRLHRIQIRNIER